MSVLHGRVLYTAMFSTRRAVWGALLPRSELQTPIGEPEVCYCRRIQRVRDECTADSLLAFDGQL